MNFDIGKLLTENFTDCDGVHTLLQSYGYDAGKSMIYQWFYREALPSKWALTLLALREIETGSPVSVARYLR